MTQSFFFLERKTSVYIFLHDRSERSRYKMREELYQGRMTFHLSNSWKFTLKHGHTYMEHKTECARTTYKILCLSFSRSLVGKVFLFFCSPLSISSLFEPRERKKKKWCNRSTYTYFIAYIIFCNIQLHLLVFNSLYQYCQFKWLVYIDKIWINTEIFMMRVFVHNTTNLHPHQCINKMCVCVCLHSFDIGNMYIRTTHFVACHNGNKRHQ